MTFKLRSIKTALVLGGALAALSSGAFAQTSTGPWSLGGSVGETDASIPNAVGDTKDTSYKLFGGYQLTPNWGAEVGYGSLGNGFGMAIPGGTATGKLTNWYGAAVGSLPVGNGFSLLGKLGATHNHADFGGIGESSRTQPLLGVGGEYAFAPGLAARLEYEDYGKFSRDGLGGNSGSLKATNVSLGLKASF